MPQNLISRRVLATGAAIALSAPRGALPATAAPHPAGTADVVNGDVRTRAMTPPRCYVPARAGTDDTADHGGASGVVTRR